MKGKTFLKDIELLWIWYNVTKKEISFSGGLKLVRRAVIVPGLELRTQREHAIYEVPDRGRMRLDGGKFWREAADGKLYNYNVFNNYIEKLQGRQKEQKNKLRTCYGNARLVPENRQNTYKF
ncbi:hypothetical protein CEXT_534581 [Caerostris extrusa]|uniref:Uncharacterized protein n=1 Tax=Caerostris extrusa TaxID=172846 RepID=A0AAV4PDU2_CAEEX|nr:hypothetical protein CEXT_534581 [Caerostris extrusa]